MSTVDLWPDFLLDEIPRTPKHILLEQATALGTKTNNVVQGSVHSGVDRDGDFSHAFVLHCPALKGYRYELFRVWHRPDLYPVFVENERVADDESGFVDFLRALFSAERTIRIIRAIIAQARSEESVIDLDDDVPF